ncbi:MAG: YkgJ family cysteine cluster protein [Nanoarchaeota archaeon]|nr:YkgJ family cysteine cluster protein [Nanoarchaeota archaeon]
MVIQIFPCKELIESGKCAGDCCGIVPINRLIFKLNKRNYQVKIKTLIRDNRTTIYPITEDGKCIFLNRSTYQCSIYDKRPLICRHYGTIKGLECPYIRFDETKRNEQEIKATQDMIDNSVDKNIDLMKKSCLKCR